MHIPSGGSDSFIDDVMGGLGMVKQDPLVCCRCKMAPKGLNNKSYCKPCQRQISLELHRTLRAIPTMADFYRPTKPRNEPPPDADGEEEDW